MVLPGPHERGKVGVARFSENNDDPKQKPRPGPHCAFVWHLSIQGTQQRPGEILERSGKNLAQLPTWQAVDARRMFDKWMTPPEGSFPCQSAHGVIFSPQDFSGPGNTLGVARAGSRIRGWSLELKSREWGGAYGGRVWSPRAGRPPRAAWLLKGVRVS